MSDLREVVEILVQRRLEVRLTDHVLQHSKYCRAFFGRDRIESVYDFVRGQHGER